MVYSFIHSEIPQEIPNTSHNTFPSLPVFQITRSQYQNGLMASRLDSSPQSPDSGHGRVDNSTSSIPHPSSENMLTLTDAPDETTSLLIEQNSQPTCQANHSTHNESPIWHTHTQFTDISHTPIGHLALFPRPVLALAITVYQCGSMKSNSLLRQTLCNTLCKTKAQRSQSVSGLRKDPCFRQTLLGVL